MTMEKTIEKRTELINFFFNEDKTYSKQDVLYKEFAVLSFSPHEDYIDTVTSPFDDMCIDLSTFDYNDTDECYIKGIVADVDKQRYKTIMHLQNKKHNVSIHISIDLANHYQSFLNVGEPVIIKCKVWNKKFFMSMLVALNDLNSDVFSNEIAYMDGSAIDTLREYKPTKKDEGYNFALIRECTQIRTKSGKDMIRGTLCMQDGESKDFGCMLTFLNHTLNGVVPRSGDFIKYKSNHDFFINSTEVVSL